MRMYRFQQLKRYLHLSDIEGGNESFSLFSKVGPLCSKVFEASKYLRILAINVSFDDMIVMKYGRSSETVRIRKKPIKAAFKLWELCDSGYAFCFFPHTNQHQ